MLSIGKRAETLPAALERAAGFARSRKIVFVNGPGTEISISYGELLNQASAGALWLKENGVRAGDKVILALAQNENFVRAFWACVMAGAVPVPLAAPGRTLFASPAIERLNNVYRILGEPRVVVDRAAAGESEKMTVGEGREISGRGAWGTTSRSFLSLPKFAPAATKAIPWEAQPSDIAFIQFSSGSTGTPKGVVLTHENVVANLRAIHAGAGVQPDDVAVSWMPLSHDLGLIGFMLGAVYCPHDLVLIQTGAFVRRPLLWLDMLHKFRGTLTACPNFGQSLVLSRMGGSHHPWDLTSVRVLVNGAEPISVELMRAFMKALAPSGLRPEAMFPVYGLAEATLAVSFPRLGDGPETGCFNRRRLNTGDRVEALSCASPEAVEIVCEGTAVAGCEIRIVDDDDRMMDDGVAGHVQARGASVTSGYYADADATQAALCHGWLRTGDMGFLRGGRLYVTGRFKDILFVNGQNFYANDIEAVACEADGMAGRRVIACAWRPPHEYSDRLIIFVASTTPERDAAVLASVRHHLQAKLGLTPHALVPLAPARFPRTTSGKPQRYKLREQYERGEFDAVAERGAHPLDEKRGGKAKVAPRNPTEQFIHALWAREIGLRQDEFGIHERFSELGGKSLNAVLILGALEDHYGLPLTPDRLNFTRRWRRWPGTWTGNLCVTICPARGNRFSADNDRRSADFHECFYHSQWSGSHDGADSAARIAGAQSRAASWRR